MGTFFILYMIIDLITRNPIVTIVVVIIVYYLIDRRYVGLLPNVMKPLHRQMRSSQLTRQVQLNPHDAPARYDLARTYMERRAYRRALSLIQDLPAPMQEAADVCYDKGVCLLHSGQTDAGERCVLQALAMDPSLRYGEPYLELATAVSPSKPAQALEYLRQFQQKNASSCESDYRLGKLLLQFNDKTGARDAWRRCLQTYRALPTFRRRVERRWATLARLRLLG